MTDVHSVSLRAAPSNGAATPALTLEALERAAASRSVDTVVLALVDMEGRLVGKRLTARHFLESAVPHGAESCEYLLATDVDMSPQQGYGLAGWNRGFGDFLLKPDLTPTRKAASRSRSLHVRSCAASSKGLALAGWWPMSAPSSSS